MVDEDIPETLRLAAAVSASPIVKGIATVDWPEVTDCAKITEIVGGVLVGSGCTVKLKALFAVFVPSLTVTVIRAKPVLPAAGVTVTVRLAPLPPN